VEPKLTKQYTGSRSSNRKSEEQGEVYAFAVKQK